MNKEKMREYCIYAITAGKKAFVGKTTSDDYGAILRRHRRGEIKHTRKHFGHRGSTEPKFVALLTVEADFTEQTTISPMFAVLWIEPPNTLIISNSLAPELSATLTLVSC